MSRGGYRTGSGRPKGSANKHTHENNLELAKRVREASGDIIEILLDIATNSVNDNARISACNALLNRGYGKIPALNEPGNAVKPTKILLVGA